MDKINESILNKLTFLIFVHENRDFPYYQYQNRQHEYCLSTRDYVDEYAEKAQKDCKDFYSQNPELFLEDVHNYKIWIENTIIVYQQLLSFVEKEYNI